jgi:DnaJ-class molecular chaperone
MPKRDYYEVLNLPKTATADEIKRAHRRLAKQFHPDANKSNPNATKRFQEIQEAYDVLSDPTKRTNYDQFGHEGVDPAAAAAAAAARGGGRRGYQTHGFDPQEFNPADFGFAGGGTSAGGIDGLEDLFRNFGSTRRGGRAQPENLDLETTAHVSFHDAIQGATIPIRIDRGDGRPEEVSFRVPAGVEDATRMRLRGKGRKGRRDFGDLYINIRVTPDDRYTRSGLDISSEVAVAAVEAMLGTTVTVETVTGPVEVKIPAGTSSGAKLRLRGHGVKKDGHAGDHFVTIKLTVPKHLSAEARALVEELKKHL